MRMNIYAQELTTEVELITKTVIPDGQTLPVTFYGIRFYLVSPPELHHTADDDDRSAITLWVPWTKKNGNDFSALSDLFLALSGVTLEAFLRDRVNA